MPDESPDSYLTLESPCSHEIKIKASRFIARGYPIDSVESAGKILAGVKKEEYSANHHCFAWVAGLDAETFKYSDDGEPSGTAGRPIYQVITGRKLKNVLVIVIRYFGGTKLGTGGLVRAYTQASIEMLDRARIVERLICDRLRFSLPIGLYDRLMRIISTEKLEINSQDFSDHVLMELSVRKSKTDKFKAQLIELTGGRIEIEKAG